ncbi:transposase IS481 family protein [Lentzea flaviverrucosa]|uniref:Leucine-zipper of insertion element IS481 n=1 Tax=Lentzea flaviverrucosa TaxID=200379 RepID=A0A1H9XYG8_9PSEU|nr:integrase core domain-containing protein [Lentzea flaviverrucosa]RDI27970.1 transposase IS481 family protein [Lentzea flaviverrucosa]SES51124.1 leucine-zipper of insertion element IS481 [Lentzea flaviverrucosa]
MSHRNARTTFLSRVLIVQRHQAGWPRAHIAAAMGISRKCVRTWLGRYAAEWAYRHAFTSNTDRTAALAPWIEHYNTQRRHSALGGHLPITRLAPT